MNLFEVLSNWGSEVKNTYDFHQFSNNYRDLCEELDEFISKHDFSIYKPDVGVFGENSTGKSTFLNAMLGTKEFETGMGETTKEITALYNNSKPNYIEDVDVVYKKRKHKHLKYMNLFDIPGFGKDFNHERLRQILTYMDIVFWSVDSSSSIKKSDLDFLQHIKNLEIKVIIIFNKIDAVSNPVAGDAIIDEIDKQIDEVEKLFSKEKLSNNLIAVFPFSATSSLANTIKEGEENALTLIDSMVNNILLYAVFIESYRGYVFNNIYFDNMRDVLDVKLRKMENIPRQVSVVLKNRLKKKISAFDSVIPWSSKDGNAKPLVRSSINELNKRTLSYKDR